MSNGEGEKIDQKVQLDTSQFEEMFSNLANSFAQGMEVLGQKIDGLRPAEPKSGKGAEVEDDFGDLETMDRKQFMKVIMKNMAKTLGQSIKTQIEESVKPYSDRVKAEEEKADEAVKQKAVEEYQELKKRPDFKEWLPEMSVLFRSNPTLSPRQLFSLARADNPEKVKELAKREDMRAFEGEGESDEKTKTEEAVFGGLLPTSTPPGETAEKMSPDQASEKAWSQVFGAKEKVGGK